MAQPTFVTGLRIPSWDLWRSSRLSIALVLLVDMLATSSLARTTGITPSDILVALILGALSLTYSVATRRSERLAVALKAGRAPNLLGAFTFAAALSLPASLITAVVAISYIGEWPSRRANPGARPHRHVYTASAIVLSALGAAEVVHLFGRGAPGIILAAGVYTAVNIGLVVAVICAAGHARASLPMLKSWRDHLQVVCAESLGVSVAFAIHWHAWAVVCVLPLLIGTQRCGLAREIEDRLDPVTDAWVREDWLAVVEEAAGRVTRYAILLISGPTAGSLLRIVQLLETELRATDVIGLWSDEAVAVMLPDAVGSSARMVGRRLDAILIQLGIPCQVSSSEAWPNGPTPLEVIAAARPVNERRPDGVSTPGQV